jgi:hypothetical protein
MERIHWAWTTVQYRADVNSELVKNLTVEKTANVLIVQLLNTDSHISTHIIYRSEQYGLQSKGYLKCLTM